MFCRCPSRAWNTHRNAKAATDRDGCRTIVCCRLTAIHKLRCGCNVDCDCLVPHEVITENAKSVERSCSQRQFDANSGLCGRSTASPRGSTASPGWGPTMCRLSSSWMRERVEIGADRSRRRHNSRTFPSGLYCGNTPLSRALWIAVRSLGMAISSSIVPICRVCRHSRSLMRSATAAFVHSSSHLKEPACWDGGRVKGMPAS